ncbi:hypothetical protein FB567DRAFT_88175 [Paraphoma chrysanthemicola]|uniref:Uncharacterized protein n=1 Tax=Paraphoma chrysanthemicola TaxID=798071 RepID=A0A8K0R487_9PLEO|nr:hypothetical protein FB567DRAFT_88175 [Paraphoma chrysanthemicola]
MTRLPLYILALMPVIALGMKKRSTVDAFGLFAYTEGFGGQPLFYANGYAYIGNASQSNSTDAATVMFETGPQDTWIASPNTTLSNSTTPSWSNVTLTLPGLAASDKRVGFTSTGNSSDGDVASGFIFYGATAMHVTNDGLESMFYALRISDQVSALYWNDTSLGQVPVVLRSLAPSNPPN